MASRPELRRLFSSVKSFTPPQPIAVKPIADPSTQLFVSGLSKRTTSEGLRVAFSKYGEVVHAHVATDRVSGYSKGFGFVKYTSIKEASAGIKGMDGQYKFFYWQFLDGWVIFAEYARPRPSPPTSQHAEPSNSYGDQ